MAIYSKTELVTRMYQLAALTAADETPSAVDLSFGETMLADLLDTLAASNVPIWNGSVDAVPSEYMGPVATYGALYLRGAYGGPPPTKQEIMDAEGALRKLSAAPPTGSVLQNEYF